MTDQEIRLECLRLAVDTSGVSDKLLMAKQYMEWVVYAEEEVPTEDISEVIREIEPTETPFLRSKKKPATAQR